ncbi:hypothetical protein EBL88_06670 [Cereibacter sphaeroides]|nr:hypothetical protein EBL88_06670 [Cereibacter sphaeroides]
MIVWISLPSRQTLSAKAGSSPPFGGVASTSTAPRETSPAILTRKGAQAALNPGETLDAEDFPKEAA